MKLNERYDEVVQNIDSIFVSYRELSDIYVQNMKSIEDHFERVSVRLSQQISNSRQALENCKNTVNQRQDVISTKLYGQGLVLLVGSCESLIRETFQRLVINNADYIKNTSKLTLSFDDVKNAVREQKSDWLGNLLVKRLEDDKNPAEKLNFQNVQQLKGLFNSYFEISLNNESLLVKLHEYWQIRHVIIHNSGRIDLRFLNNLKAANIDCMKYSIGNLVHVGKIEYEDCKNLFRELFIELDKEIENKRLSLEN